ncbi:MAG TPA: RidA family protein [Phycisphaerae bacterium]|jgi:enamine deaminase RidA (YjgF/YER057c/UK114 family)|nr:RidA family protein [Phycisphaerae bacterium]
MSQLPNYALTDRGATKTCSTGSVWEPKMGYSRAVRKGNMIFVTGTVGINADKSYTADVGAQARRSLDIVKGAIEALGGKITDVVRTRMYVTDVTQWEKVAAVHGEVFANIRPATTIVEVARLIDEEALIEIEADAVL